MVPPSKEAPVDLTNAVLNNLLHLSENRLVTPSLPHQAKGQTDWG
jgi:hypothetical protein